MGEVDAQRYYSKTHGGGWVQTEAQPPLSKDRIDMIFNQIYNKQTNTDNLCKADGSA